MEIILEQIKATLLHSNITSTNLTLTKIVIIITIIIFTQLLRGLFSSIVITRIKSFTSGTKTTLDDELVEILEQPLGWLIFIVGLGIVQLILAENIQPQVSEMLGKILNLSAIVAVAYIIYRASPLLGEVLYKLALNTKTELDDLLIPYIPRLCRTVAIAVVVLKASEVFLGASISALVGLLGGVGITFGLLLKEIIYDWFCTIVIYTDNIYRPGDWVIIEGIDGSIEVLEIGLRTTKLRLAKWDSIKKIPNSKMITGIVENWSQNPSFEQSFGINIILKIDNISAAKTSRICDAIRSLPKSISSLNDQYTIWFDGLDRNARVINIRVFNNNLDLYNSTCEEVNLAILVILEKEGVDTLHVEFRTHLSQFPINAPTQFAGTIDTVQ
jgi:MscS family membrane protein